MIPTFEADEKGAPMMFVRTARAAVLALAATAALAPAAAANSLENLERERAQLIQTALDPALGADARQAKLASAQHRLVDLERMVLRDDKLRGDTSPVTRIAFQNYDLTFLVHASTEHETTVVEHWMDQLGLTTSAVMNARAGRR
jgi:hypothetical protein